MSLGAFVKDRGSILLQVDSFPSGYSNDSIYGYDNGINKFISVDMEGFVHCRRGNVVSNGQDMTTKLNLLLANSGVQGVIFDLKGGGAITINGTVNVPSHKHLVFYSGTYLTGSGTINGGIINAGINQKLFDITLSIVPETLATDKWYPEWFGALGNGTNDDAPAIQATINAAISSTSIKTVGLQVKNYKINSPLILYSLSSNNYVTFNLDLIGGVNSNAGITNKCTTLTCGFNDKFAVGAQNARSCTIKNLLILGQYSSGKTYKQVCEDAASSWILTSRDTQYSPYSGIIIDPFGASVPSDGGYPGLSSYYRSSAAGSSGITVENCYITNFVVGYALAINGTTSNAENMTVRNCRIYNTKIACAVGVDQTRGCIIKDSFIFSCLNVMDTLSYGAGIGSPLVMSNLIFSNLRSIVNVGTNRGSLSVLDCYGEAIWRIGVIGPDRNASFKNCAFKLEYGNSPLFVKAPDSYVVGGGNVDFYSCYFTKEGDQNYNACFSDCNAQFYSCFMEAKNVPYQNVQNAVYNNCKIFGINLTGGEKNGVNFNPTFGYNGFRLKRNLNTVSPSITHHVLASGNNSASIGSNITVTSTGDTTAVFTPSDVSKIKVGDAIYATVPLPYTFTFDGTSDNNLAPLLGTVSDITAGVVTIKDVPLGFVTGVFTLANQWSDIYYGAIMGSTTNGSNVITNVYKESGSSLVGARIYSADPQLFPFGLYVVSEDTNARTLTLSGNMNTTQASIGLYTAYFDAEIIVGVDPSTITGMFVEKGNIIKSRGTNLTDKAYLVTASGIVGNGTHVPSFKSITVS